MTMISLLLAHASEIPHVHPHETGLALGLSLVLAFLAGGVLAMLKRRPAAS
jgi:hypothetical protein